MQNLLIENFSADEEKRITTHLRKLLKYLKKDQFVIVGGLAIRYHLASLGIKLPARPFNDLDIVAQDSSVILPSVSQDFLIYHYHPENNSSFFIALVDPESKTKVDIFDNSVPCRETVDVIFENHILKIRSLEDQLVKTVLDTLKVAEGLKVDPKQFIDGKLLFQISNIKKANKIWKKGGFGKLAPSINEAFKKANEIAEQKPELVVEKPYRRSKPYQCKDCKGTPEFTITPMEEIYKILGYIE